MEEFLISLIKINNIYFHNYYTFHANKKVLNGFPLAELGSCGESAKQTPCEGKRIANLQQVNLLLSTWSLWRSQCLRITSVDGQNAAMTQPTARRFLILETWTWSSIPLNTKSRQSQVNPDFVLSLGRRVGPCTPRSFSLRTHLSTVQPTCGWWPSVLLITSSLVDDAMARWLIIRWFFEWTSKPRRFWLRQF